MCRRIAPLALAAAILIAGNAAAQTPDSVPGGVPADTIVVPADIVVVPADTGVVTANPGTPSAQPVPITGTVTTAEDGRPLAGARVVVKGRGIVTLTGTNGRYAIAAVSASDTLVLSMIGFRPVEVAIGGRRVVNVVMEPAAVMMQEIVVTGYGTQQRRDVTGAVASVKAEDLPPIASASVEQLLQGGVAGVQVTPTSGRPGDRAIVRIRGVGTLNDASPLYVVDGMPLDDISFLDASDIASIEVLKDASATAIYGSRGANGVIIVSTQRGAVGRPTRFMLRSYAGTQSILSPIALVNAQQYAMLANELAANQGVADYFANPDAVGQGTDWQNMIFNDAPVRSYELSSSGGSDKTTYFFSGNYFRQSGVVPSSDFNRLTLRLNTDYQLSDRLLVGHNIAFSHTSGLRPPDVLSPIYRADPTIAPQNAAGVWNDANLRASAGNPAAMVFYTRNEEAGGRLVGNLFAELNLLDHFTLRSSFGLDYGRREFKNFVPIFDVSPTQRNIDSRLDVETRNSTSWLWENTLTYSYMADQHRLNLLTGVTAQALTDDSLGCGRRNMAGESENLWYCNAGDAGAQTNFNGAQDWRMLSYLVRANYALRDRYLLTASLRVDGSSRFGPANRYGYFPSVAVGWNLTEEPFLRDSRAISALKLRASWGQTGNDKIGAYPSVAIVTGNLNGVFGPEETLTYGATPIDLANPDVRWERTSQTNFGTDMALFGGRLEATVDYYRRVTDGILVRVPIPKYVGVSSEPYVNAATVLNSGVEGAFTVHGVWGALRYNIGLNGATIRNRVLRLGQGKEEITGGGLGNETASTTNTIVGRPIGCFWGYKVAGVFQTAEEIASSPRLGPEQPGDLRYANVNGDNVLDSKDMTYIGCPIPDVVFGFSARATWGRFDFSSGFSGQAGNEVYNGKKAVRFGVENFETSYLNRWHGPRTSNWEPRVTNAGHNYLPSDRFIEDGSFLKMHSMQLGYRLPHSLAGRLGDARVYVSGTNLFQITHYTGYTPELTASSVIASGIDLGIFPPARTFTVGMDLTF